MYYIVIYNHTFLYTPTVLLFSCMQMQQSGHFFVFNETHLISVRQSMPINELGLKPTSWKVVVMSKHDILLLLWAKQWIHCSDFTISKGKKQKPRGSVKQCLDSLDPAEFIYNSLLHPSCLSRWFLSLFPKLIYVHCL